MLWIVHRGMAVFQGRLVWLVCNQKETTLYENHAVRFRQSVQSKSRVEPGRQPIRGVSVVSDDTVCKGMHVLASPGSRKNIWGKKKSLLRAYISPSISQIYNKLCAPLENKMSEIYFYKEGCFILFIKVCYLLLCSWLGLWGVYNSITRTSPSGGLVFYPGHSLGFFTPLQRSGQSILEPQPTG